MNITNTLKGFKNLKDFSQFLEEQINDGEEISKGKNPDETSEEQEKEEAEPEAPVADMGGAPPGMPPEEAPAEAPGAQVTIGNKVEDPSSSPFPKKIKISGRTDVVDVSPQAVINQSKFR